MELLEEARAFYPGQHGPLCALVLLVPLSLARVMRLCSWPCYGQLSGPRSLSFCAGLFVSLENPGGAFAVYLARTLIGVWRAYWA